MINFIKNNYKTIIKYLLIYLLVFISYQYLITSLKFGDSTTLFAFSHALRHGQVIYKDFNTIITPLYAVIMSLGLYIYDSYITFVIEQSILVTILIYFLNRLC